MSILVTIGLPWAITIFYLICCAFTDIKWRYINTNLSLAAAVAGICFIFIFENKDIIYHLSGIIPGLLLMMMSKITRGAIGMGDGIMFSVAGIYIGFNEAVNLFYVSIFLCSIVSGILLIVGRHSGKDRLPFAPFALSGAASVFVYDIIVGYIL